MTDPREQIPLEELRADRAETVADIRTCKVALAKGITTYGDGQSVPYRLNKNYEILATIDELILKKEAANAP